MPAPCGRARRRRGHAGDPDAAATLGGPQTEAAIQTLHGERPLAGSRVNLDIRTGKLDRYDLALDRTCHGIHRRAAEPTQLDVTGGDAVGRLLEKVVRELGPDSSIALPHRFVQDAFCDICTKWVDVPVRRGGPRR